MNWFQGTGIRQKVNEQQVRLLLCSPSSWLSPLKRTKLLLVFQPSSPVFSQQLSGTRKTEPARTKVVCSPLAWAFKPAKNHTEPEWKQEGPDFSGTIVGRGNGPYISFEGPSRSQGPGLFTHWGPDDHSHGAWSRGRVTPGGWSGDCVSLNLSAWDRIMGDHTHTHINTTKKKGWIHENFTCV